MSIRFKNPFSKETYRIIEMDGKPVKCFLTKCAVGSSFQKNRWWLKEEYITITSKGIFRELELERVGRYLTLKEKLC